MLTWRGVVPGVACAECVGVRYPRVFPGGGVCVGGGAHHYGVRLRGGGGAVLRHHSGGAGGGGDVRIVVISCLFLAFFVCFLSFVVCCLLFVVYCLLFVVFFFVCRLLVVVWSIFGQFLDWNDWLIEAVMV